jgi:hypothetical protein
MENKEEKCKKYFGILSTTINLEVSQNVEINIGRARLKIFDPGLSKAEKNSLWKLIDLVKEGKITEAYKWIEECSKKYHSVFDASILKYERKIVK